MEDDEDFDLEDDEVKPASKAKPSRKNLQRKMMMTMMMTVMKK